MLFRLLFQVPFSLRQLTVLTLQHRHIEIDHALNAFVWKRVAQLLTSTDVFQIHLIGRKIILTRGISDMGLEIRTMANQVSSAA